MPNVTVAAIITRTENGTREILLTKRSKGMHNYPGAWVLPGGHVDEYELRKTAVIREVKEETGLDYHPTLFGVYDEIIPERKVHAVVTVYMGPCDGKIEMDEGEVAAIGWYTLDAALSGDLELGFEHHKIITDYKNNQSS